MQAGKLRHRIELQRLQEIRDAHGGVTRDFRTFATVWGQVKPLSGQELFHAKQVEPRITHEVSIRRRTDLTAEDRMLHLGRPFNVLAITDTDERHRENLIRAVEVV